MKDVYEKLAYDYDEFGNIEDYLGKEKYFFEKIFEKYSVNTVLDCACGTGQHLFMVHQLEKEVYGSDFSQSMLDVAKNNLQRNNINIPLLQCDFRYLNRVFTQKFDSILCLTNSMSHLHTDDELLIALKSMNNQLNDDGVLILTSGTTHWSLTQTPKIETIVNTQDFSRVFIKEQCNGYLLLDILDLFHAPNRIESNQYKIKYKILYQEDYLNLLKSAGFSTIHFYGDYDMNIYEKESSRRIIVVAKK